MEKSKVFFTDFRTNYNGMSMPEKLKRLCRKAGIADRRPHVGRDRRARPCFHAYRLQPPGYSPASEENGRIFR